jgi:hypothetical protein
VLESVTETPLAGTGQRVELAQQRGLNATGR